MLSLKTYILSFQIIIHMLQKKRMFFSVHKQKERAKNSIQIIRFLLQKQFTFNTIHRQQRDTYE